MDMDSVLLDEQAAVRAALRSAAAAASVADSPAAAVRALGAARGAELGREIAAYAAAAELLVRAPLRPRAAARADALRARVGALDPTPSRADAFEDDLAAIRADFRVLTTSAPWLRR